MNENEQAQQVPLAEQVRQQETELRRLRAAYATAIAALDGTKTRQDRLDARRALCQALYNEDVSESVEPLDYKGRIDAMLTEGIMRRHPKAIADWSTVRFEEGMRLVEAMGKVLQDVAQRVRRQ